MNIKKSIIKNLNKCYSIAPFKFNNKNHFIVAAEKQDPCYLFDEFGKEIATIWEEPGGTMSMVQVPNKENIFLATHKFYSPNDSKESKIVIVTKNEDNFEIKTLVSLPHVHRFDIITSGDTNYLIACTLKSGHEFKDDWNHKGKVYVSKLPDDLSQFDDNNQLKLTVLKEDMLKNHGYYKIIDENIALISSDEGVFKFIPPKTENDNWEIIQLLDIPASDAVLIDIDNDGKKELAVIESFHGDYISFYKENNNKYELVYRYDKKAEFAHAIFGGYIYDKPVVIIGHRKGERNLILFEYDNGYKYSYIDTDCGPANVFKFTRNDGKEILISTNREIDEIAMYEFEK